MHFVSFLLKNLTRRRTRTALTVCGVGVAVATMVALLGVAEGFERTSNEAFDSHGIDVVVVSAGLLDLLSSDIDENVADRLLAVPGVAAAAPGLLEPVAFTTDQGDVINLMVQGWRPDSFLVADLHIIHGQAFHTGAPREAMLGVLLAEKIAKRVGDTIQVQGEEFEVVGIFESFNLQENGGLILPLNQFQELMARGNSVTGFSLRLAPPGERPSTEEVCSQIESLTDDQGENLNLSAKPTQDFVSTSLHIRMAHSMALLTSAIAVLVGTIGMLNTMIMSVVERVREISILRAIGWRKSRIVRMVVGESMLLSLVGAMVGTAFALLIITWLPKLPEIGGFISPDVAPSVLGKGFAMAVLVGMLGGIYPAYRAANLLPVEGLRHE